MLSLGCSFYRTNNKLRSEKNVQSKPKSSEYLELSSSVLEIRSPGPHCLIHYCRVLNACTCQAYMVSQLAMFFTPGRAKL